MAGLPYITEKGLEKHFGGSVRLVNWEFGEGVTRILCEGRLYRGEDEFYLRSGPSWGKQL